MKRNILLSLGLFLIICLLTGCGNNNKNDNNTSTTQQGSNNKKLSCTITETDKKYTKDNKIIINYTDNRINRTSVETNIKYVSGKADTKNIKKMKDECTNSIKNKGVTCGSNSTKDSISVSYTFNIDKMDDISKDNSIYKEVSEYENMSYEELKKLLEETNYICN